MIRGVIGISYRFSAEDHDGEKSVESILCLSSTVVSSCISIGYIARLRMSSRSLASREFLLVISIFCGIIYSHKYLILIYL